jgi:hypothetical protein
MVKSIKTSVAELHNSLNILAGDCVRLMSHPDATQEQINSARECMVNTQARINDINEKLVNVKVAQGHQSLHLSFVSQKYVDDRR